MKQNTRPLVQLTDALYRAELAKLDTVVAEETRLRTALADLTAQQKAGVDPADPRITSMRQIGADILWQGWLDRKRRTLQSDLARCLVRKNRMMQQIAKAFGRTNAAQNLHDAALAQQRAKVTKKEFERQRELLLLKMSSHGRT